MILRLPPKTLWPLATDRTQTALRSGALQPIDTVTERIEDFGIRFILRIVSSLKRKPVDDGPASNRGPSANPFLPYDRTLFVAELSDTHVCLLNRFNVIDHHLLFITRQFEDQELPLTRHDFEAVLVGLREIDGLAFYNAGRAAGASQSHRHLQLVPLPLVIGERRLPIEALIRNALSANDHPQATLPFRHAGIRLPGEWIEDPSGAASAMVRSYVGLLKASALIHGSPTNSETHLPPYNLLITRDWMLLIPRSRACWRDISVNALGYAGSLFMRNREQLSAVKSHGPMNVLSGVGMPI